MSLCAEKRRENESSWLEGDLAVFHGPAHLYVGISTSSTCIYGKLSSLEKNCSIHGQWNRFSLDRNDELPLHFFLWKFFFFGKTYVLQQQKLR